MELFGIVITPQLLFVMLVVAVFVGRVVVSWFDSLDK
jgi:hypothetical protein